LYLEAKDLELRPIMKHLLRFLLGISLVTLSAAQTGAPQKPFEPRMPGMTPSPQCANHQTFQSPSLQRQMAYCVILPADYQTSQRSYAVLYLLHGLWGDENDWPARTKIADYVRSLPLIVVTPEGDDGWYTNSATDPRNRYEDYIFTDIPHEIETKYRVLKTRDSRFLAGLSMGGYGAMKGALKYPQNYAAVGTFSSAFNTTRGNDTERKTPGMAFGPPHSPARHDNDLYFLMAKADTASLPYLFTSCGTEDPLLAANEEMQLFMQTLHVHYEYHAMPGIHDWAFWDKSVGMFLRELTTRFPALQASAPPR
jgi:putative tributyrin esterase